MTVLRTRKCRWPYCCCLCGSGVLAGTIEAEIEPGHWAHLKPCAQKHIDLDRLAVSAVPTGTDG